MPPLSWLTGLIFLFRAFHALPPLTTSTGFTPTQSVAQFQQFKS